MALTKLFQIVDAEKSRVVRTRRSREECEQWLEAADYSDYMADIYLTIREVWTNASETEIKQLTKK